MDLWESTWYDDLLFVLLFLLAIFSLLMVIYAIVVTVMACLNKYSSEAAGLYWISVAIGLLICVCGYGGAGILFWICSSPIVAFAMSCMERNRKLKTPAQD